MFRGLIFLTKIQKHFWKCNFQRVIINYYCWDIILNMVNVKSLKEVIPFFVGSESAPDVEDLGNECALDVEDLPNIGFGYFLNILHWDLT